MDGEFSSVRPDGAPERLVGNTTSFRHPERFSRGKRAGWHSFGYFSFATKRKVTRQWGETHNLIEPHKGQIKTKNHGMRRIGSYS